MATTVLEIPGDHLRLFWDTDMDQVDLEQHALFLIPRVLEHGTLEQAAWIRRYCGDARVREALLTSGAERSLSARGLNFWALILGLPQDWAQQCIAAKLASPWRR